MFQRIYKSHRPPSNQVSMLQSRLQTDMFSEGVKLPAAICQRSPLKSRGSNPLNYNTSRHGTPNKKSPSPILSRRGSNISTNSFLNSQAQPGPQIKTSKMRQTVKQQPSYVVQRIQEQPLEKVGMLRMVPVIKTERETVHLKQVSDQPRHCSNTIHDLKPATYLVSSEDGSDLLYCQKCAILLASQGWKVKKIELEQPEVKLDLKQSRMRSLESSLQSKNMRNQALNEVENIQRRSQLTLFLNEVNTLYYEFKARRNSIKSVIYQNSQSQKELNKSIHQYFDELVRIIETQKSKAIEEMEIQRAKVRQGAEEELKLLVESMDDCSMMLDDIFSSIDLIKHVDDKSFSKVMDTYKLKCKQHSDLASKSLPTLMIPSNLKLVDLSLLSQKMSSVTKIRFKSKGKENISDSNKVEFSFQKKQNQEENSLRPETGNEKQLSGKKMNTQVDSRYIKKFDDSNEY